jgi:hypothetical protein
LVPRIPTDTAKGLPFLDVTKAAELVTTEIIRLAVIEDHQASKNPPGTTLEIWFLETLSGLKLVTFSSRDPEASKLALDGACVVPGLERQSTQYPFWQQLNNISEFLGFV